MDIKLTSKRACVVTVTTGTVEYKGKTYKFWYEEDLRDLSETLQAEPGTPELPDDLYEQLYNWLADLK